MSYALCVYISTCITEWSLFIASNSVLIQVELVETQISAFHKEAENIKLKVEECASARETVNEILPSMREKAAELEELFAIIDSLESYVKHVDECVTAMENRCSTIEQAQGGNILSRKLGSFFSAFSSGEKKKKRPVVPLWSAEQAVPRADELIDTAPTLPAE